MAQEAAQRLDAREIYDRVVANGRSELNRSTGALAFSGFASGLFMGMTAMGVAGALAVLPGRGYEFVALLFYPVGFIAVVIGRAQLFTENTLFPVVLILHARRHVVVTLRLWGVVFAANVLGALAFAGLVSMTGALPPSVVTELVRLGTAAVAVPAPDVFTSAIIGGWLIALMAWLVTGAQSTIGQLAVIWLVTFLVGLLHLAHCIASSGYILVATLAGDVSGWAYLAWLGLATAGNIVGGVIIVALLNYWQVRAGEHGGRLRKLRLAENETVFRRLNERLAEPGNGDQADRVREFVCECSNRDCHERISMSDTEYRHLRDKPDRFAVVEGHETPEIEPVVERCDGYVIVEKTGEPGEVAERSYPE